MHMNKRLDRAGTLRAERHKGVLIEDSEAAL